MAMPPLQSLSCVNPSPSLLLSTLRVYGLLTWLASSLQDSTLWAHIFVNMLAFGVLFPLGMVLGVSLPLY